MFLKEQRVTHRRHLRRAARARGPAARRRPALPARARRPRASTGTRSGSRSSPSTPRATGSATSARPTSSACAPRCCPDGVEAEVWQLAGGDRIAFENYSDLLTARHFRQSVLCHAGRAGRASSRRRSARERLHWAVRPNAEPLEVGLLADAFAELDRAPPARARLRRAARAPRRRPGELAAALLDGFRRERLIPHAGPLHAAREPGERPVASRARALAGRAAAPRLTSLAYMTVRMEEPAARLLITLLDGTRDRDAIRAELQRARRPRADRGPRHQPRRARAAVPARAVTPRRRRRRAVYSRAGPRTGPRPKVRRRSLMCGRAFARPWATMRGQRGQTSADTWE